MNIFCDECRNNIATVFLTKISGSEVSKVQLCEECAKKMEETTEAANLLSFLPQILLGLQGMNEEAVDDVLTGELISCGFCGTSFDEFQKIGFLGCSKCYQAFSEPLEKVIFDFQEADEHLGKIPGKASETSRLRRKLLELGRHLEHQIAAEEYEAAAAVRDKIREIEGRIEAQSQDHERE